MGMLHKVQAMNGNDGTRSQFPSPPPGLAITGPSAFGNSSRRPRSFIV